MKVYKCRDDAGNLGLPIRMKRLEGCVPEPGMTSFVFDYDWIPLYSTIIQKPVCSAQQLTRHESMAHTMLINATLAPSRMQHCRADLALSSSVHTSPMTPCKSTVPSADDCT